MSRRTLLQTVAVLMLGASLSACNEEKTDSPNFHASADSVPVSGRDVPGMESFDAPVKALLDQFNVAGATLAIAKDGRLILARGYGYADFEAGQRMQPEATLRIASISKLITAASILQLRDQGRIDLDQRAFDILSEYQLPADGDQRLRDITVRHLLQHAGGWDREIAGDPMGQGSVNAGMFQIALRATCPDLIRAMMSMPLQFTPGSQYQYSNFGFCILGRVIEDITGQPYEIYVRDHVLAALDVHSMSTGYEQLALRGPYEPKYYGFDGERKEQSIIAGEGLVEPAYGGYNLEAADSSGGWIASAIDLARVMTAVDGSRRQLITPAAYDEMIANPQPQTLTGSYWPGFGVEVGPTATTWSKNGRLPGSQSLVVHNRYGYSWIFLANTGPADVGGFQSAIVAAIQQGFDAHGPNGFIGSSADLFEQYPSPTLPARHH